MNGLPILTYHSIDASGSVISTSPDQFRRQMQQLKDSGFRTIALSELSRCLKEKIEFPDNAFVLTFDDAFRNFLEVAFPILQTHDFSATVFVVTGRCGKDNGWAGQPSEIPVLPLMSWEEIRSLSLKGIDFGSHSENHSDLSSLSVESARSEVINSKNTLAAQLGHEPAFFAYPYGKSNDRIKHMIDSEFQGGVSTRMGLTSPESDPYFLPRIEMFYFSNNDFLSFMGTSKFSLYVRSRSLFRAMKNAVMLS